MKNDQCICTTGNQGTQSNPNCRVHNCSVHSHLSNYYMTPFPLSPPILSAQSDMEKLHAKLDKIILLLERGVK